MPCFIRLFYFFVVCRDPQYGFDQHKGYGTAAHLAALQEYGVLPEHRQDFAPVKALLAQGRLFE